MTDDGRLVAGRYRLGQRIGSGAMGVVWQAHDERLHRTVAVKQLLLQPGLAEADTDEAKRRAMREGRIAARLQHPHAIAVYDVAEDDGQPWLVMEYLPSKSLSTALSERGTLPPRDVASIGQQVASALAAAHNAGIVHRDIKPGNILLGHDGTVKITDFGISRATGDVTVTATGMLAGTPAYLAPEVAKGYDPGPPSDVFSLGSTLYAAVEGAPPFGLNENTIALLHQVASGKVVPPKQAGPLTALLMRLLRAEPEDRPTMAEAREALAAVAAGRAAPEFPVPLPQTHPPSWQGAPVQVPAAATRAMPPDRHTPPGGNPAVNNPAATRVAPVPAPPPQQRPAAAPPRRPAGQARPAGSGPLRSRRSTVVTALAIAGAAVVGILLASLMSGGGDGDNQAGQTTTTTTAQAAGAAPSTTQTQKVATPPGPYTSAPTRDQQEKAVRDYYELLPGNLDGSWAWLAPSMQNSKGGFAGYKGWWDRVESVDLHEVKYNSEYAYEIDVTFHMKDGSDSRERKLIVLQWSDQSLFISNEQNLGSA
ncbi:serine/threonine-protein kinase [Saccharothrix syringae]|uniref:non-specific serine/threonine protein kinase n=1 Tax=Saccharothrix syringae TaxID=103733 RepID=A0A5Q0HB46_SACSY|nr:serine/threonine-protein kinase [Saccharothrix syringae]QFZ23399.1 serine/threonine protein kinase [Saccharothrix syringae]